jgi:hypothetical protein
MESPTSQNRRRPDVPRVAAAGSGHVAWKIRQFRTYDSLTQLNTDTNAALLATLLENHRAFLRYLERTRRRPWLA